MFSLKKPSGSALICLKTIFIKKLSIQDQQSVIVHLEDINSPEMVRLVVVYVSRKRGAKFCVASRLFDMNTTLGE